MNTKEQASTRRCMMLELIQTHSQDRPEGPVGCIGSSCMWWKGMWRRKVEDRTYWDREELASKPTAPGKDWERVGHCGLVGDSRDGIS